MIITIIIIINSSTVKIVEAVEVVVVDPQNCPSVEPNSEDASKFLNMRMESDPVSETEVQKTSYPKCNVPPSETFKNVQSKFFFSSRSHDRKSIYMCRPHPYIFLTIMAQYNLTAIHVYLYFSSNKKQWTTS